MSGESSQRDESDDVAEEPAFGSRILDRASSEVRYADANGAFWSVKEKDASRTPGARERSCLIFDSVDMIRRVWTYPANWRMLSAEALVALSWKR